MPVCTLLTSPPAIVEYPRHLSRCKYEAIPKHIAETLERDSPPTPVGMCGVGAIVKSSLCPSLERDSTMCLSQKRAPSRTNFETSLGS